VRSSALIRTKLIPANTLIPSRRAKTTAAIFAVTAIAISAGCHHEPALPAKPPIAVRLADVTLYQSNEGLQYSASLIPYAQVDVAFRTTGYVTDVKQIKSADGRTRDIGTGDYVKKGTVLAQIRRQDLKNQADESTAQVDSAVAQHAQADQDFNRATALYA
jgi:multidrug efflux pump subunit AcrA (membrane-fusion protein)